MVDDQAAVTNAEQEEQARREIQVLLEELRRARAALSWLEEQIRAFVSNKPNL
jgi:hypothetical protein